MQRELLGEYHSKDWPAHGGYPGPAIAVVAASASMASRPIARLRRLGLYEDYMRSTGRGVRRHKAKRYGKGFFVMARKGGQVIVFRPADYTNRERQAAKALAKRRARKANA